jgi:hypothetical protein
MRIILNRDFIVYAQHGWADTSQTTVERAQVLAKSM